MITEEKTYTKEEKLAFFTDELNLISNSDIRKFTEDMLDKLPSYFFTVSAAARKTHHPETSHGEGGLVKHSIAAVNIAYDLVSRNDTFKSCKEYSDHIVSALILHDGCKSGKTSQGKYAVEHPLLVCELIRENYNDKNSELICSLISSHMGQWNTNFGSNIEVLPKPQNVLQSVVHLADYLASRRYLDFNFNKKGG